MGATTQNNLVLRDAGGNWQTLRTTNEDGVHTLVTSAGAPATAGGGSGSSSVPTAALSSTSYASTSFTVAAGALSVYLVAAEGATLTVNSVAVPDGRLSINAPDGYLLPAIAGAVTGGNCYAHVLRP